MKQRVSVLAIAKDDDKILLVRRAVGRPSLIGGYELPSGVVDYGEHPEDALKRHVIAAIGVDVQTAQLYDVLSYIDNDDRDIQYVVIIYTVALSLHGRKIELGQVYDHYVWKELSNIQQLVVNNPSKLLLSLLQLRTTSDNRQVVGHESTDQVAAAKHVIIYSDGGSRGNPGPSAAGFVIMNRAEQVIHEGGMYLGITTNNQAEYHGVRLGLEKAQELGARSVDFRVDSMLVVNQMNGLYTIKNRELWPIHERIGELVATFDKVTFTHVKRELNQLADGMVNKILNAHVNG